MIKTMLFVLAATVSFAAVTVCFAQEPAATAQGKYYRFDFVVKELDGGKVLSTKNYFMIGGARGNQGMSIRTGDKVPTPSGNGQQFTYLDVGTNIDCHIVFETSAELGLWVSADISGADSQSRPVISQTKWSSSVVAPLRKPTVIFTSDSATKKVQTQLEVTITPLP
jgi:hypothetical protein